jgi:hypothetical protein
VRTIDRRLRQATFDIVVPDARYLNEVEYLKNAGFKVIRVSRTDGKDYPRYEFIKDAAPGTLVIPEWLPGTLNKISADYSIIDEEKSKEKTYEEIRKIVEIEREDNV